MVCKILAEHGLLWRDGTSDPFQAARGNDTHAYKTYEHPTIKAALKSCIDRDPKKRQWPKGTMVEVTNPRLDIMKDTMQRCDNWHPIDFVKSGVEFADLWSAWGALASRKINFIKVYRPPEDIAASLERRGIGPYDLGYEIAAKRIKLMDGIPGVTVATNMLMNELDWGYSGIEDAVLSCGIEWNRESTLWGIQREKFHG